MVKAEAAIRTLKELKALGVGISLDDFGTGHSSLSYLKRLPIDVLKIDQSFLRDLTDGSDEAAIIHAVIAMAHSLSLRVVAEGVETADQLAVLATHKRDLAQGFLFSEPVPAPSCEALLQRRRLRRGDLAAVHTRIPEGIDAYCPERARVYCRDHYRIEEEWDEGFYDCTRATCPAGHRRMIED